MERIQINGFQLFSILFLFQLGSTILVGMAQAALQDAWITVGISLIAGCFLYYYVYAQLHKEYPNEPFTTYIRSIWGKYIGWFVGLVYLTFYIYDACRVLRDFEELLVISVYQSTSILVMGICMILCIMYAVSKGFEVFARVAELCFFIVLFVFLLIILFGFIGSLVNFKNLQPMLENGWKPVFHVVFPQTVTVAFGEAFTFTMIFPYANDKRTTVQKAGLLAIILSGLSLLIFTILLISILGADIVGRSSFPILTAVSYINIAGFIQRVDTLVIIIMVILGFIKISVFFFCAVYASADLFRVKQPNKLIYPIAIIIVVCSIVVAPNYTLHISEGRRVFPYYIGIPLETCIPLLLLITIWIKKKLKTT